MNHFKKLNLWTSTYVPLNLGKGPFYIAALCCLALLGAAGNSSLRATPLASNPAGNDMMHLSFAGKGTSMAWDVGVMRAAYEALPALREGRVLVSGSSSGAVLAAAMGCRGFSEASLAHVEENFSKFDRTIVDESPAKNAMVLLGLPTEADPSSLDHLLDVILDGDKCTPNFPMLIPAGNYELLNVRSNKPLLGLKDRTFNVADFTVTKDGQNLGKACTYFVDKQMMAILNKVPREERLCDLRLIESNKEMRMAIMASISEPSYFAPFSDPAPEKIIRSGDASLPGLTQRSYWGGASMDVPVQDIKRALPQIYTMTTGRAPFLQIVDKLMSQMSLVELTPLADRAKWFVDLEATMTAEMANHLNQPQYDFPEQITKGYEMAKACLESDACQPEVTIVPENHTIPANHPSGLSGDLAPYTGRGMRGLN